MNAPAEDEELHWFLLAYVIPTLGMMTPHSFFGCCKTQQLTVPLMSAMAKKRNIPDGSVLTSVSYIGFMSTKVFTGTSDKPGENHSDAFHKGLTAALERGNEASNPYKLPGHESAELASLSEEWDAGFAEGTRSKASPVSP